MATVLLLGGTGAMGVYLRQILAERGDHIYVTSRRERKNEERIRFIRGDAHDDQFFTSTVKEVHPDAIVDFMIYTTEEFRARHNMLVSASGQYLFLSSYRVFADETPLTERSPRLLDVCNDPEYLATDEYALRKARQEDILRNGVSRNWTIVRPAITYSKERFQFGCLESNVVCFRSLAGVPVVMPAEMMGKRTTLTWGGDVARMIAGLVGNPKALGDDFICASSESRTWSQIAHIYRDAIGMEVKPCPLEWYIKLLDAKYQVMCDRMYDRVIDNNKILSITGIDKNSLVPPEKGLPMELAEFMRHPYYRWMPVERQAAIDKLTKTTLPLSTLSTFSIANRKLYLKTRYSGFLRSPIGQIVLEIVRFGLRIRRQFCCMVGRFAER